jgi:hypothetical protein
MLAKELGYHEHEEVARNIGTHALVPPCCLFVCSGSSGIVTQLGLIQLSEVLLVCGSATETALAAVVCDSLIETSCCSLRIIFAVGL